MRCGVNYLATFWHYEEYYTPDSVLHRDFTFFQSQGVNLICLTPNWRYMEPSIGNYRESYIDDLIRVSNIAAQYGIEVIFDFHTLKHDNSFTIPTWVPGSVFHTVFTENYVREAWLNMLGYVVSRLWDLPNLHSWHMMNEPMEFASVDDWITLWIEMKDIFKARSNKPVSIRLSSSTVFSSFNNDPRIYDIFDYMTFNWYKEWDTIQQLETLVLDAKSRGKAVMIGEYGSRTSNDEFQAADYRQQLEWYKSLGIDSTLAWLWRSDYASGNPDTIGTSWIIAKNTDGEPRPAFYVVAEFNEPTPEPPKLSTRVVTSVFGATVGSMIGYQFGGSTGAGIGAGTGIIIGEALRGVLAPGEAIRGVLASPVEATCSECERRFDISSYHVPVWCPYCGKEQIVERRG